MRIIQIDAIVSRCKLRERERNQLEDDTNDTCNRWWDKRRRNSTNQDRWEVDEEWGEKQISEIWKETVIKYAKTMKRKIDCCLSWCSYEIPVTMCLLQHMLMFVDWSMWWYLLIWWYSQMRKDLMKERMIIWRHNFSRIVLTTLTEIGSYGLISPDRCISLFRYTVQRPSRKCVNDSALENNCFTNIWCIDRLTFLFIETL